MNLARDVILILVAAMLSNFLNLVDSNTTCDGNRVSYSAEDKCLDYEWCLYKFYAEVKTWFDAKAICEEGNMTLAHITATTQYTYLYNLMKSTLSTLFASPPSAVWLGAYHYSGKTLWQDDCNSVDSTYIAARSLTEGACFLLEDTSTFKAEPCSSSRAFLCQESTLEVQTCFAFSTVATDVSRALTTFSVTNNVECFHKCLGNEIDDDCVGIALRSTKKCEILEYSSGYTLTKPSSIYVRDMIRTTVQTLITASISDLQYVCPSSVGTPSHHTSGITPTQTFSGTTTTSSTPTSILMGPSNIESSNPEPVTPAKMTSESTPPLPSEVKSVNLEKTSLPTVSETTSSLCSECSCIKSTSVKQAEMEESISKLKEQLHVNPKKLSSFKRKLTSAPDDRQSAANIGYVAALILCLIPGFIILMDMGRLTREFKQFISHLRNSHRATANVTPLKRT